MENETVTKRIEYLMWNQRMSQRAFAKEVGVSSASINRILSGVGKPSMDTIEAITRTFDVNPIWLISGEGEIYLNSNELEVAKTQPAKEAPLADSAILAELKSMRSEFSRLVSVLETQSELLRKPSGSRKFLMVPPLRVA